MTRSPRTAAVSSLQPSDTLELQDLSMPRQEDILEDISSDKTQGEVPLVPNRVC